MNRLTRTLLALAVAFGIALPTTVACSSPAVTYPTPATWYVGYMGTNYCGYTWDPHEIDMYGSGLACQKVVWPSMGAAVLAGSLNAALMSYLTEYDGFYHSGLWYDQYYAPIGARYHVTVISRQTFTSYSHDFETKYAKDIKTNTGKAKWSNNKTGAYDFPTSNKNAKNKPLTNNTQKAGSDASGNRGLISGDSGGGSTAARKSGTTSSTGKSGTTRSVSSGGSRRR
jgi:hypothetical protein